MRPRAIGYSLGRDRSISDVLADDAELLKSEGIDPAWPGFTNKGAKTAKHRRNG